MPRPSATLDVVNLDAIDHLLRQLPGKAGKKAARAATATAATPVSREARRRAPRESGALKRAMGKRTKSYKHAVVTVVGPRRGVSIDFNGERRTPANYGHLVEFGHVNPDGGRTPAKPFMRPAMKAVRHESERIARQKMAQVIKAEAEKMGSKIR